MVPDQGKRSEMDQRDQRAAAAFRAISERRSGVSFDARRFPPSAPFRRAWAMASESSGGSAGSFPSCRAATVSTIRRAV